MHFIQVVVLIWYLIKTPNAERDEERERGGVTGSNL